MSRPRMVTTLTGSNVVDCIKSKDRVTRWTLRQRPIGLGRDLEIKNDSDSWVGSGDN